MKFTERVEVYFREFLTSTLDWCEWSVSRSGRFTPQGMIPCYALDRRLGGLQNRSGRGSEENMSQPPPGIETWNLDSPARSLVLYRLSYHGSVRCAKYTQ
jgi:hypothetical protein